MPNQVQNGKNKSWQIGEQRDPVDSSVDNYTGVDNPSADHSQKPLTRMGHEHSPLPGVNLTDVIEHTHDGALDEAMNDRQAHIRRTRKGTSGSTILG
jgi:hypothetical protein